MKKILVVDDEAGFVKIVQMRLEMEGFEVITALDGEQGLVRAFSDKPDLILLDLSMPGMSGEDVLDKLMEHDETRSVPVIILTGRAGAENVVKCMTEGRAKDYIVKPFATDDFLKKINTALMDKIDKKVKKALGEGDNK